MIPKSGHRFSDKIMREQRLLDAQINAMTDEASRPAARCAICGKPAAEPFRPFCSKRCRDVDLNRWLSGVYAIPVEEDGEEEAKPRDASQDEPS